MLILQSMEHYDELIEFDLISGKKRKISRKAQPEYSKRLIQGSFSEIEHHFVSLFRSGDTLHLCIDDKDIILTNSIKIVYDQENSQGNISLKIIDKIGNQVITELKYTKPKIYPPLEVDPTPFVEEEDFDYGLFLSNVVGDPDRKNRIYRD